jgi:hypothetical protein
MPEEIKSIVYESLYHRKMAHSAEDITQMVLQRMGVPKADGHDDVRHGFILCYLKQPKVDLALVDELVKEIIDKDYPIIPEGINTISVGDMKMECTGPRIHVRSTGEIKNFSLYKDYLYDQLQDNYKIVGMVGERPKSFFANI